MFLLLLACAPAIGPDALAALESDEQVTVVEDRWISFLPAEELDPEQALIFYPGGDVPHHAYAPPLRLLAEAGLAVHLLPMPMDLAILGVGRGDWPVEEHPEVRRWVLAGHSLGGVAAASYAHENPELVSALALWASYPQDKHDLSQADLAVLSMVGSEDEVVDEDNYRASEDLLPPDTRWVVVEGGNHAQFGDYGEQDGDGEASITPQQQWALAAEHTLALVE